MSADDSTERLVTSDPATRAISPSNLQNRDSTAQQRPCIHDWIEAQVLRTPDNIAVVGSDEALTYQELNQRANQLAHYLRFSRGEAPPTHKVTPDTLVAIHMTRSVALIVAFLAVLKAGGAYVPIDPTYPAERRAYLLENSQAPVLLTQSSLLKTLPAYEGACICVDQDWPKISQQPETNPHRNTVADNLAYAIYTSGSTGNPKGVLIPHQGLVNHARSMAAAFDLTEQDCILQFSSMSFDIIIEELYPTFITGGSVVLRTDAVVQSVGACLDSLSSARLRY